MAGSFKNGETKVRPGVYFRIEKGSGNELAGARNGIVAVAFKANWGALNQVMTLESPDEIYGLYGDDGQSNSNVAVLEKIFKGGASVIKAVRVGSGGTKAAHTLKDTTGSPVDVVALTARYAGTRPLSVTIRDSLASPTTLRECIIYTGTKILMQVEFAKGTSEVDALVAAINAVTNGVVTAAKVAAGNGTLAAITQVAFSTVGVSPTIATADYSGAFTALEASKWGVLCVDTNDAAVHALVKSYINRVNDAGLLAFAVVGEPVSVAYATRRTNAAAFNSCNVVYCLNGGYDSSNVLHDGFNVAAVVAGMLAALPSSDSPTHKQVPGLVSIAGALTNTEVQECLQSGALVLTMSASGVVWIEQGINTLVSPSADQDSGWKKIRRTKTRFELISRILESSESIIGSVNNDSNGRATFIAIANGVGKAMIAEGKLQSCTVSEDPNNPPSGDSAWFIIDVIDNDSVEKVYVTYRFRFSASE
jgi:hypothetical protein